MLIWAAKPVTNSSQFFLENSHWNRMRLRFSTILLHQQHLGSTWIGLFKRFCYLFLTALQVQTLNLGETTSDQTNFQNLLVLLESDEVRAWEELLIFIANSYAALIEKFPFLSAIQISLSPDVTLMSLILVILAISNKFMADILQ